MVENRLLPLFKVGRRKWCGRKSTLRRHIDGLEARQAGAGDAA